MDIWNEWFDEGGASDVLTHAMSDNLSSQHTFIYSYPFPFIRYVAKNLKLYELSNDGLKLSTHAQANFCRGELAKALRKGPFQVNVILGGYDEKTPTGGSLYVMDYLGSCTKANYGAQGYASNFCLSIMDRDWDEGLTEDQAVKIVEHCIRELQMRFLINQSNFIIKVIDKDGLRTLKYGADPADN